MRRALTSPTIARRAALAALVIALPSLGAGLALDDRWHRAMCTHDSRWLPSTSDDAVSRWWDLFTFLSGDPTEHASLVERGVVPWWSSPELRLSFFRPLSAATHGLDYTLYPWSPALMHAHSIAWYVALVLVVSKLYQRFLGPISPLACGIATLFYAIDPTHALPVGWLANRNAVVASTFALASLLVHHLSRTQTSRRGWLALASALTLGLALLSGESAIAVLSFFGAYALFLDARPIGVRSLALLPHAAVTTAWVVAYRAGHFGAIGSGMYRYSRVRRRPDQSIHVAPCTPYAQRRSLRPGRRGWIMAIQAWTEWILRTCAIWREVIVRSPTYTRLGSGRMCALGHGKRSSSCFPTVVDSPFSLSPPPPASPRSAAPPRRTTRAMSRRPNQRSSRRVS